MLLIPAQVGALGEIASSVTRQVSWETIVSLFGLVACGGAVCRLTKAHAIARGPAILLGLRSMGLESKPM